MEDVIFAGTSGRAPLGRAEVALTIDNTDGALPIDYTEVTIARTMFRNGGSDYSINGTPCRLLDVQELLSDSGIGREMHVIVGQGQLDAVLRATPEERRGFIEEAAGVLKHRKRKERALRKLETMESNLTRVQDLTGEIRRQLGPLGRQAETARRAAVIQADARDARLRLLADDLVQLTSTLEQEVADESALIARRTEVEAAMAELATRLAAARGRRRAGAPRAHPRPGRLRRRRAARRAACRDPLARGRARAPALRGRRARARRPVARPRAAEGAVRPGARAGAGPRRRDRSAPRPHSRRPCSPAPPPSAATPRRPRGWPAPPAPPPTVVRASPSSAGRSGPRPRASRPARPRSDACAPPSSRARPEPPRPSASSPTSRPASPRTRRARRVSTPPTRRPPSGSRPPRPSSPAGRRPRRAAERARTTAAARVEALELSLRRKDGAAALLAASDDAHDILGSVASLVTVEPGLENAVAAALGSAAEALAVGSLDAAATALDALRDDDSGRASLLVAESATRVDPGSWPTLPEGARWAREVVECPDSVRPAVEQVLERVALVTDRCRRRPPRPGAPRPHRRHPRRRRLCPGHRAGRQHDGPEPDRAAGRVRGRPEPDGRSHPRR